MVADPILPTCGQLCGRVRQPGTLQPPELAPQKIPQFAMQHVMHQVCRNQHQMGLREQVLLHQHDRLH